MGFVLILLLIVTHVYAKEFSLRGKVFIQYNNWMTWGDAQAYCREHHTDLITIKDSVENSDLNYNGFYGWIGMYRETSTSPWKWSNGDEQVQYNTIQLYNTLYSTATGNCIFYAYSWYAENCNQTNAFICYALSLVLVKEEKTWEEALAHCRSMEVIDPSAYNNHSHDLASIVTQDDYILAQEMKQQATTEQVWTGLRFQGDQWMWVGGEKVQYPNINTCPDTGRCGTVNKSSTDLYVLRECKNKYNFFCSKNP